MKRTIFFVFLLLLNHQANAFLLDDAYEAFKRGDKKTAFKIAIKFAKEGHAEAQNYVANLYSAGWGVEQDYQAAVNWTRKAIKQGSIDAICTMGNMYRDGEGVEQDYQAALNWYHKGAKSKSYYARSCKVGIGLMYQEGNGVIQNKSIAKKWFDKACNNDTDPDNNSGCIFSEMLEDKGY